MSFVCVLCVYIFLCSVPDRYAGVALALSWASSLANPEDTARRLAAILAIPSGEKVLNSVLGQLEYNRQAEQRFVQDTDCGEVLPEYTESIQDGHDRNSRQLVQKHSPLCHLERKIRKLSTTEYEYRPAYYEEVRCVSSEEGNGGVSNEICSSLGLSCVQWNKTIHLTRRRYSSDCWETRTFIIPAGCECLWPNQKLGDITLHI